MKHRRIINYIFTLAFGLLTLVACEKVIEDFDFLESDPKLVVYAPFIADSSLVIHVSHTVGIMEDDNFNFIDDAQVELYRNEMLLSTASYSDSGFYSFGVIPVAGEIYQLRVSAPGFPDTKAVVEMPERTQGLSTQFISREDNGSLFSFSCVDHAEINNYYGLSIEVLDGYIEYDEYGPVDTIIYGIRNLDLSSSDIDVFGAMYSYSLVTDNWNDEFYGSTLVLSDQYHNGTNFSIDFYIYDVISALKIGAPLMVDLETYDENYISYLISMELYNNSIDNPISEKVTLYTNIEGGLGLAYCKTISKYEYYLSPEEFQGEQ